MDKPNEQDFDNECYVMDRFLWLIRFSRNFLRNFGGLIFWCYYSKNMDPGSVSSLNAYSSRAPTIRHWPYRSRVSSRLLMASTTERSLISSMYAYVPWACHVFLLPRSDGYLRVQGRAAVQVWINCSLKVHLWRYTWCITLTMLCDVNHHSLF